MNIEKAIESPVSVKVPEIYRALSQCMNDVGEVGIAKDNRARYAFRSIDQVLAVFNRIFAKNKVCIVPSMIDTEINQMTANSKGTPQFYISTSYSVKFVSAIDGSSQTAVYSGANCGAELSKLSGQLSSYLQKELFFKMFNVPTEGLEDIDALFPDDSQSDRHAGEWVDFNGKGGRDGALSWACRILNFSQSEAIALLDSTPANPDSGSKGENFVARVRLLWEKQNK